VDGGSTDGTVQRAAERGAKCIEAKGDRAKARNIGAANTAAPVLLFLDADMIADPGLIAECVARISDRDALIIPERTKSGNNLWARARALERDGLSGDPRYETPRCFTKNLFNRAGQFDSSMVGLEDIDLRERIIRLGANLGWTKSTVTHDEESVGFGNYLQKRAIYGKVDSTFKRRYPSAWASMRSPTHRLKRAVRSARSYGATKGSLLIAALILQRGSEVLLRLAARKRSYAC